MLVLGVMGYLHYALADLILADEPEEKVIQLELWKYDPMLFAKNGVVDPISLALCFEGNADERIEASIEEYLEDYKW